MNAQCLGRCMGRRILNRGVRTWWPGTSSSWGWYLCV
jgi:hypothetical protein